MSNEIVPMDEVWKSAISAEIGGVFGKKILSRYGFEGEAPLTLGATGMILYRTRERVRQLERKWIEGLERMNFLELWAHEGFLQRLERGLGNIEGEMVTELQKEGWLGGKWGVGGIKMVYELMGRPLNISAVETDEGNFWLNGERTVKAKEVRAAVVRAHRRKGSRMRESALYEDILANLQQKGVGEKWTVNDLKAILTHFRQIIPLNDKAVVSAASAVNNSRFFTASKSTLAVTGPLRAETLLEGVARRYEARGLKAPPLETALQLWQNCEQFVFNKEGGVVNLALEVRAKPLPKAEMAVVEKCRELGVAARGQIVDHMEGEGFPVASISTAISFCPALQAMPGKRGFWRVRSDEPLEQQGDSSTIRRRNPYATKVLESGEKEVRISFTVNYKFIGLLYLPRAVSEKLRGKKFAIVGQEWENISVSDTGASWGYLPYCQRKEGQDTVYEVKFDLNNKLAYIKSAS